jgi:hypothetical protein
VIVRCGLRVDETVASLGHGSSVNRNPQGLL